MRHAAAPLLPALYIYFNIYRAFYLKLFHPPWHWLTTQVTLTYDSIVHLSVVRNYALLIYFQLTLWTDFFIWYVLYLWPRRCMSVLRPRSIKLVFVIPAILLIQCVISANRNWRKILTGFIHEFIFHLSLTRYHGQCFNGHNYSY